MSNFWRIDNEFTNCGISHLEDPKGGATIRGNTTLVLAQTGVDLEKFLCCQVTWHKALNWKFDVFIPHRQFTVKNDTPDG